MPPVLGNFTDTLSASFQYRDESGRTLAVAALTDSWEAGSRTRINEPIPVSLDQEDSTQVAFTSDVSQLRIIIITADAELAVLTNNVFTPIDAFLITKTKPLVWSIGMGTPNPFTADVTSLWVFNAGAATANLNILKLEDPTV